MKVSLNWIRVFLDIHKTPNEIADILTSLGLEVEGWEEVKNSPVDLDKVLTGLVKRCEKIPDTDHLSATIVDVGDGLERSVVCGAPNVSAGQKVLVALPGAQVFSKDGSLFTIGERKVRGVASQGMICAQDELGIGTDHSGIMVLPAETPLGISAAAWLKMEGDTVFEIGLTPNRADATNHLGIARDLLAWIRMHENPNAEIAPPAQSVKPLTAPSEVFPVKVRNTEACPRFTGIVIKDLQVAESPEWLQNRLRAVGQRPINNIVDVTNYIRTAYGQPLHAYDLSKIKGGEIIVTTLPKDTLFQSLDGQERKLFAEDLMICDGEETPMCIGGVFGGLHSGVTDTTTDIFLEAAYFHPSWIRRSMIRHGLRTDAAWMFEKGVDPNGCLDALHKAVALVLEVAGGRPASAFVDHYPTPLQPLHIEVRYDHVNRLIGENLPKEKVKAILKALDIDVAGETDEGFTAIAPTNKPDVTREADIIEEILRIHGLDNVPVPHQIRSSVEIQRRPSPDYVRNQVSDLLAGAGFNEAMNLSLTNSAYHVGEDALLPFDRLAYIHNSANQGLDCMRPTLLFSGLETVLRNQNRQHPDLRLFEFGKVYGRSGEPTGQFTETLRLGLWLSGAHSAESWHPAAKKNADFYTLKSQVAHVLARLGLKGFQETNYAETPFQYGLKYHRGETELVTFGAVHPLILKKMEIRQAVFFADFHFENMLEAHRNQSVQFSELNRFPSVRRDLALILDKTVAFGEIGKLAHKTAKKLLKEINLFDVFEDESKIGAGKKSYAVSFIFEDAEKTLQDKEIDGQMAALQEAFENKLGATVRK